MRKFLSVVLSAAMLLSVMLTVSVSAQPYEAYPYVFEDFEDGTLGTVQRNTAQKLSYAEGGVGGSRGSALVEITETEYHEISVPCVIAPRADQTPVFSAWIKLDNTDLNKDTVSFIIYGKVNLHKTDDSVDGEAVKQVSAWKQLYVSNSGIKKGEWVYVSAEGSWDGKMQANSVVGYDGFTEANKQCHTEDIVSLDRFSVRVGQYGGTRDLPEGSEETSVRYYLDDIRYECVPTITAEPITIGENLVDCGEFDEDSDLLKSCVGTPYEIVNDENDPAPDGSAGYLKLMPEEGKTRFAEYKQSATWKPNHVYKVSYYMKYLGPFDEGVTNTSKVKKWESGEDAKDITVTQFGAWLLQEATTGKGRVEDTNGFNMNYPGRSTVADIGNGWTKVEYYYVHEYKTFTEQPFQMWLRLYPGTNRNIASNAIFGLDSFKMIDLGPISNGDFEIGAEKLSKTGTDEQQNVLGWTENGATSAQSDAVRDGSDGQHSMKVTISENEGYVYQGLHLSNQLCYKISFWAKGENLESEIPFALVMDRTVTASGGEKESYEVPEYQYITGDGEIHGTYNDNIKENQSWKLSNEWRKYEFYYGNTFLLKDGLTKANTNTMPRLPFLYFVVNDNQAGTSYYLDDMEIECVGVAGGNAPEVTNFTVEGDFIPEEDVTVDYTFTCEDGRKDASMVRIMCKTDGDRYVSLGSFKASDTIYVPLTTFGKEIMFEIVPIDSAGVCGEVLRVAPSETGKKWTLMKVDNETFSADIYASEAVSGTLVYAAYSNKQMISVNSFDLTEPSNHLSFNNIPDTLIDYYGEEADLVRVMFVDSLGNLVPLCGDTQIYYDRTIPNE